MNSSPAIADFTQAIAPDPQFADAYVNRGYAYVFSAPPDFERAIVDFSQASTLNPENPECLRLRDMAIEAQAEAKAGKRP